MCDDDISFKIISLVKAISQICQICLRIHSQDTKLSEKVFFRLRFDDAAVVIGLCRLCSPRLVHLIESILFIESIYFMSHRNKKY